MIMLLSTAAKAAVGGATAVAAGWVLTRRPVATALSDIAESLERERVNRRERRFAHSVLDAVMGV